MTDKRIPGSGQKKKNKTSVISDGQLKKCRALSSEEDRVMARAQR